LVHVDRAYVEEHFGADELFSEVVVASGTDAEIGREQGGCEDECDCEESESERLHETARPPEIRDCERSPVHEQFQIISLPV
jgi:hypothetical protein